MYLLPNDRGDVVFNVIPKLGLGPPNIFGGLTTTQCALLHVGTGGAASRMAQILVYASAAAGSVLYGGCVKKA